MRKSWLHVYIATIHNANSHLEWLQPGAKIFATKTGPVVIIHWFSVSSTASSQGLIASYSQVMNTGCVTMCT